VSVTVVTVTVATVTIVTVSMVTVAGFEWPVPTHRTIFSIPDLKSKPECGVAAVFGWVENRQNEGERRPSDFRSLAGLCRR
jgi:hypothetical protein